MRFFLWYYHGGIRGFFQIWKNYLVHTEDFFSVGDLLRTLFSPWHRDITPKTWRGFNPFQSMKRGAENAFSRIIGAFVRICIIVAAIFCESMLLFWGGLLFLLWVSAPFVIMGTLFVLWISPYAMLGFFAGALIILLALWCFKESQSIPYAQYELQYFYEQSFFDRILARVDLEKKDITRNDMISKEALQAFLERKNIRTENFIKALEWEIQLADERRKRSRFWTQEELSKTRSLARQWKYGYTPQLDEVSEDVFIASSGQFQSMRVCAQRKSLELLSLILARPAQNSALIVGTPGSGRKTLITWFAKYVYERVLQGPFRDIRMIRIDIERVISQSGGDSKRSANNLEYLFAQAAFAGNVILVIEDIEYYIGENALRNGNPDISPLLEKYLPLPSFRLLAVTSVEAYHSFMERGKGVFKSMERIELEEINTDMTLDVMLDEFSEMEKKGVIFTIKGLRHIAEQSGRFDMGTPLPERALDLAKETMIYWQNNSQHSRYIDSKVVNEYITLKTGIPAGALSGGEKEKLLHFEEIMAKRIIGQRQAVSQISKALRKARSEMTGSMKPIGTFLFLGPTGVGKTEMAKVLAKSYFGGEAGLVRLDMSEFQSPSSVGQLIGSRELNMTGQLTTLVKDNPYGVLLLDELEKASGGVLDIFLQILDEGFFTDAFGTKVRFNNLIIIATSNAGAPRIKTYFEEHFEGGDITSIEKEVIDEIVEQRVFRVEFLNRFDGVIFFAPLNQEELLRVTEVLLGEFSESIWKQKRIKLTFHQEIPSLVVEKGYDAPFGARSLKRFIADTIESVVADRIISEEMQEGGDIVISPDDVRRALEN